MSSRSDREINSSCDMFDGQVILAACSDFQPMEWTFPKINKCPLKECALTCLNRKAALIHFSAYHATTSIACTVCNELFLASNPLKVFLHYQQKHPDQKPPKLKLVDGESVGKDEEDKEDGGGDEKSETQKSKITVEAEKDGWIALEAHGYKTSWLFPNTKKCPAVRCRAKFKSRSLAIAHYRAKHATKSILCSICNKPICSTQLEFFGMHYKRKHPSVEIPINLHQLAGTSQYEAKPIITPRQKEKVTDNDNDDIITLNGCGITTHWRYPEDTRKCPAKNCGRKSKTQAYAIAHYKRIHSKDAILCEICNKPLSVTNQNNFISHYKRQHPNEQVPHNLQTTSCNVEERTLRGKKVRIGIRRRRGHWRKSKPIITRIANSRLIDEDDSQIASKSDDWITLTGFDRITKWKFPDVKCCPVERCGESFESRSLAINHYRMIHSMNYILCILCQKPILVHKTSLKNFKEHYKTVHPNESFQKLEAIDPEMMTEMKSKPKEEKHIQRRINEKISVQRNNLKRCSNELNNLKIFICPLKCCNYSTERIIEFRCHWDDKHSHLDLPEMVNETISAQSTNSSKNHTDENEKSDRDYEDDSDESLLKVLPTPDSSESSSNESIPTTSRSKAVQSQSSSYYMTIRNDDLKSVRKTPSKRKRETRSRSCKISMSNGSEISSISSDSNTSTDTSCSTSGVLSDDQQKIRGAKRFTRSKRRRAMKSSSEDSCSEVSFSDQSASGAVTRPEVAKKYIESTDDDDSASLEEESEKIVPAQDIPLDTINSPEKPMTNDLQISLYEEKVHQDEHSMENRTNEDNSFYVPDSDEEMASKGSIVKPELDITMDDINSKSDDSHVRLLSVIMIPKKQI